MELDIKEIVHKRFKEPYYVIYITFMECDGDGKRVLTTVFSDTEKDIINMKKLLLSIACCNAAYPHGRSEYDEYDGLPEYDAYFRRIIELANYDKLIEECGIEFVNDKEQYEYVKTWLKETYNPGEIYIDHPSDSYDISTSFDGYDVHYIDNNGDRHDVDIKFNDLEMNQIENAKKFFFD